MTEGRRPPGRDIVEEMRIEAIEKQMDIDDNWDTIFRHIATYSRDLNIPSEEITFEGIAESIGEGDFFIKIGVVHQISPHEPRELAASLYYSPNGEKDEGVCMQVSSARADWVMGQAYLTRPTPQPVPVGPATVLDAFDMIYDVHRIIDEDLDILDSPFYFKPETDLKC